MRSGVLTCILTVAAVIMGGCNSSVPTTPYVGTLPPSILMDSIPSGTFQMGDTSADVGAIPVHNVTLGAFAISQTPVTQAQYDAVMGNNPSYFDSGNAWPVEQVSWYNAALFCNALSKLSVPPKDTVYVYGDRRMDSTVVIDYTKNGYRLPTEAEYEYACRAGTTTDYYWGRNYPPDSTADTLALDSNAVWANNSNGTTRPVMTRKPNAFGLYDMSGDVWEWCNDWFGSYNDTSQTNPTGATIGSFPGGNKRVLRGGSWSLNVSASTLCSAYRNSTNPYHAYSNIGFRVVCGAR
ncbi:MAG: SUMF1/EgtB/PvdO family nonheme iron enzyme [Chitinispirillaceae bacterium]